MATLDEIAAGLISFRNETYSRFDSLVDGLVAFRDATYIRMDTLDTALSDLQDLIDAKNKVYRQCTTCHGEGKLIYYDDSTPGIPMERVCPLCLGEKEVFWGEIKL